MRDVDEHLVAALSLVAPLEVLAVPLGESLGRILAQDVLALWPSPPFTNSAMDGYALRRADVLGASASAPARLSLVGESAAGRPFEGTVGTGEAARIMTGAVIPSGADAVVPVEKASDDGALVSIREEPREAAHIRREGEDIGEGAIALRAGTRLAPASVAAAASVGHATLPVRRRPVVAVLATGDELVEPGTAPGPGHISDSNSVVVAALVAAAGAEPCVLPRVSDDRGAIREALEGIRADLIVTTGGVSAGAYDVVKLALADAGVEFSAVAMQPGKPQGLGRVGGTPILCLPGNPVSVLVSFCVFARPMLRVLAGEPQSAARTAIVAQGWRSPPARRQYMPVQFRADGAVAPASPGGSGSHLVASLAAAEALAVVPAGREGVEPGDTVEILEVG
jgi:molybdopterin molybdotransferase